MAKIFIGDEGFELQKDETILEALERLGCRVEYQCREGYCGSCRLKIEGCCDYKTMPLAWAGAGEILTCCAIARSDITLSKNLFPLRAVLK